MEKRLIRHHNLFGHEINESLEFFADDVLDREIYCRREHQIIEPVESNCLKCPCFAGVEQGHGCECAWMDVEDTDLVVQHMDRYREYERVDKLIKVGVLESVKDIPEFHVKNLPYDENEWIYKQSKDMKNRYLLGIRGKKTLICCGVNPSTASPNDLDPTMKRVKSFAEKSGYDSYVMINLYPMRSTNPDKMHDTMDKEIVENNLKYIKEIISTGNVDVWAAWGKLIEKRAYLKGCLSQIAELAYTYHCKWYTIGETTKDGHPRHPLYLNGQCELVDFDIAGYLKKL